MTPDTFSLPGRISAIRVSLLTVRLLAFLPPALLFTAVAASMACAQAPERRPLTVEDMFRIQRVSNPVVSYDGRRVAYVVSTQDLEEDSQHSDVWMLELTGDTRPWRMTTGEESAGSPAFSPDGRYLSFLATRGEDATQQVWVMDLRGGEARPLTDLDRPVRDYQWGPDSGRLALLLRDEEPDREEDSNGHAEPDDEGEPTGDEASDDDDTTDGDEADRPPPWVIDRLQFKRDYGGYVDRRRTHVYVLDLASDSLVRLTSGDYDDGSVAWSPDGSRVVFVSNRTVEPDANYDTDIWIVPARGPDGSDGAMPRFSGASADDPPGTRIRHDAIEVSPGSGSDASPVWSPDGSQTAWLTSLRPEIGGYAMSHLALAVPGQEPRVLTRALDRSVSSPRFWEDGERVLALLESEGARSLVAIPVDGSRLDTIWGGERRVEAFAPVPSGTTGVAPGSIVAQASTADAPSELWLVEPSGSARQLTGHNAELLAELRLGRVTKEAVTAPDGTELEAFYTFPPELEETATSPTGGGSRTDEAGGGRALGLPTILWIHGGPMGQDSWGWHGLRQLFAAHGYLVVQPNYRGSHGYGQDFALGLWQDWGGPERVDVVAAVDHAIERGWADSTRLGVGGWSYGGITTNAVITHTDRFRAAISGAGAALHVASWGHDQYQRWYLQELGPPWENRELWERLSTFNRVEHITTPTLWIGGERDWNVPILQSEIMYQSMRKLGRETLLVVYPGQSHGGFPPVYEADRYRRFLGWFGRYLGMDDSMWPGAWPDSLRR